MGGDDGATRPQGPGRLSAVLTACGDGRRSQEVNPVLNDLAVLVPPLLVCAAFLIAVAAFLRHEMGASRRRHDRDDCGDISTDGTFADTARSQASAQSDDEGASGAD